MSLSVVLAGGGSTGHVAPLLALADCLRRRDPGVRVIALGTAEGLEARLVPEAGYPLAVVPRLPLPRRPSVDLGRLPFRLRSAVAEAARAMEEADAQAVVGFGGYVSTPAYLAARRLGLPIVVHEQNARPGLANRLGARFTPYVGVTFPGTPLRGARVIGMPLRRQITTLDRAALRDEALASFGLEPGRTTLLVF
ncbi:MAG TPA: glycosyltransferase, partial [Kineosporiaceae bacterium]|nr:glycosyltransferase [Kineosporiaceae bacterium]